MSSEYNSPDWQPPLILMSHYNGNWNLYIEAVYAAFKKDFVDSSPMYKGRRLGLKKYPMTQGKEVTFWHMTSTGADEDERTPDIRRCERIQWPKPIIELDDKSILSWVAVKKRENRIHLWFQQEDYVVVLAQRNNYILPWTAFLIDRSHTKKKLQREYEKYQKEGKS